MNFLGCLSGADPEVSGIGAFGKLGGGNSNIFYFHGEMIQFDEYFSDGLKPPTSKRLEVKSGIR